MSPQIPAKQTQFWQELNKNTTSVMFMGFIILLMGIFAIAAPLVTGLSLAIMVGIIFIIGGVGQLVFAFKSGKGVLTFLTGVLTVLIGGYMLGNPNATLASLTLFLAAYLIVSGLAHAVMALQVRPVKGWGWALFNGFISVLLGVMIWNQFPLSGEWAMGTLLGINLLCSGWTLIMFGTAARNNQKILTIK